MRSNWRYRPERWLFRTLLRIFVGRRLHVDGLERLPTTGPLILVGNHVATMDPPLAGALLDRTDVFYMTKAEALQTRWAQFLLYGWNAFPVVRNTADRRAIRTALQALAEGHVVVMFPEGTRSDDTTLHRAMPGAGFLALRSGAPVACAAVAGSEGVLPKGARWPSRADVRLRYGVPFTISRRRPDGTRVTNQEAADLIMDRLSELLPEAYRGVYGTRDGPGAGAAAAGDERTGRPGGDTALKGPGDVDAAPPADPAAPAA